MKFFFFLLSTVGCNSVHAGPPPSDGLLDKAGFVSSLIKHGDIGAEIGVCAGVFAYHCLLQQKPSKLYLIDPWQYGLQADVDLNPTAEKQAGRDAQYQIVFETFAPFPNVEVVRMKSEEAVTLFQNDFFDYVYIDGEHSYNAVLRDLTNYFPKIKVGGYLIGDDYGWAGISQAVQKFLNDHADEVFWFGDPYKGKTGGQFAIRRLK